MKRLVHTIAIVLIATFLLCAFSGVCSAAEEVTHENYINGYSDGLFRPKGSLTRAEVAQIFYNLMPELEEGPSVFSDVDDSLWFSKPVNALAAAGILNGYIDGTFRPNNPVKRSELITILSNITAVQEEQSAHEELPADEEQSADEEPPADESADDADETEEPAFTDVLQTHWAYAAIMMAQKNGWVNGYDDGSFRPGNTMNRAETVTTINRYLGRVPDTAMIDQNPNARFFPDVTADEWFYYQVMEAAVTHELEYEDAAENWKSVTNYQTTAKDGFHVYNGNLYVVKDSCYVVGSQTGTYNGIKYTCLGDNGVCSVDTTLLELFDDRICVLKGGRLCKGKGLFEYNNAMYYGQSDGFVLQNGTWNTLRFDADGKYTSGNKKIDAFIDNIVSSVTDKSMSQQEKLRQCHHYVFYQMEYLGNNNHVPRGADCTTWTETYMLQLIERGKGNCYCYASEMYYLARRLGYWTAKAVSGAVVTPYDDHGWLEIVIDGKTYIFDPEYSRKKRRDEPDSMFMKTYGNTPWPYYPPK